MVQDIYSREVKMELSYHANYVIYLFSIGVAILALWNILDFIVGFKLSSFPLLSVKNLAGIGLLYTSVQIMRRRVDYA